MVSLRIFGSDLVLDDPQSKEQFVYGLNSFERNSGQGKVQLSNDDVLIIVDEAQFQGLALPEKKNPKDFKIILYGSLALLVILVGLYQSRKAVIATILDLLPNDFLTYPTEELAKNFKLQHCLTEDQDRLLSAVVQRLGENRDEYTIAVVASPVVNAFVLPGKTIVINDQLLKEMETPEAFAGILAHELAHVNHRHLEIGLVKSGFFELLWVSVFGQSGVPGLLKEYTKGLFSQEEEQEADAFAAKQLREQKIDLAGVRKFFSELERSDPQFLKYFSSTHPQYQDRIRTFSQSAYPVEPIRLPLEWKVLQQGCILEK